MRLMGLIKGLLLISLVFLVFVTRSLLAPLQRYEKHNCSVFTPCFYIVDIKRRSMLFSRQ